MTLNISASALTINVPEYWPFETVTNTFDSGIVFDYTPVQGGMRLRQFKNNIWQCDWFYRNDYVRGILEYQDDYPKTAWQQKLQFWTPVISQPCVSGKEIIWGASDQAVGDSLGAPCQTAGLFGQYGWQQLRFDALLPTFETPAGTFKDVLVLRYWQTWSDKPSQGAQMWFAKGLGQIKALWELNGIPTGFGMMLQSTTASGLIA